MVFSKLNLILRYNRFILSKTTAQNLQSYVKYNWLLQSRVIGFYRAKSSLKSTQNSHSEIVGSHSKDGFLPSDLLHILYQGANLEDLDEVDLCLVTERFGLKGLNIDYIYQHGVKVSSDLNSLLFPFDSLAKDFSGIQSIIYSKDTKEYTTSIVPSKSSFNLLFGWSSIGFSQKEIIVVSDPLDAVAVNQETDLPVVSLPCDFTQFSLELINALKSFHKVTFWLNSKWHGSDVHNFLGQSLGKSAFFVSPLDYPCALKSLQSKFKVQHILKGADPIYHEGVDTVASYRTVLLERFKNHEKQYGLKWKRFSVLNELLKGHRKRELTIFSGQTGTGKTTFMSEYSLDLCMQGLPTLWASFEISNERLLETMLCQYAQCSVVENLDCFHHWYDEFEKIPLFILNIQGRQSLKEMLQAMKIYVKAHEVQHIVVDNLQFLMNIEHYSSMIDQYRRQDEIYGAFRGFATKFNCHVTLVIHPRKEPEFTELNNASISGTAKATQEADNILILQTTKTRQYLHVTKNRYAGVKGCVIVEFDKKSQTFKQKKVSPTFDRQEQKKVL